MIDGLVEFSVHDKRASRRVSFNLSKLRLQIPSLSNHPGNLLSILFTFILLNASLVFAKPPEFTNCPTSPITNSHCNTFYFDFDATDPDGDTITYELASGPGSVNPSTGLWTWAGATASDAGVSLSVTIRAVTARGKAKCTAEIQITNQRPVLTSGCGLSDSVLVGKFSFRDFNHTDDCGTSTYSIVPLSSGIGGIYQIHPTTGVVAIKLISEDLLLPQPLSYLIITTDEAGAADSCEYYVTGRDLPPYVFEISEKEIQSGVHARIDLLVRGIDEEKGFNAFDFQIGVPEGVIEIDSIVRGSCIVDTDWDYFTYRVFSPVEVDGKLYRRIRVVGIHRLHGSLEDENCSAVAAPDTLAPSLAKFYLKFSESQAFACNSAPIRFIWNECGDNSLSSYNQDTFFFLDWGVSECPSQSTISPDCIIDQEPVTFPNFLGSLDSCFIPNTPRPIFSDILFENGQISISCSNPIDLLGDINMNDIRYELADLVMFIDYFHVGLPAFGSHKMGSTVVSDINRDGIPLTIADLILMGEIVYGNVGPTIPGQGEIEGGK